MLRSTQPVSDPVPDPDPDPDPDIALLHAWRSGDRSAGDHLMRRYYRRVVGFFRLRVPGAAEDLAQRTFLICTESRDRVVAGSFAGYVFGVARNLLLKQLDAYRRDPSSIVLPPAESTLSPSRVSRMRQEHWLLLRALERLPDDVQITMALHYVQALKAREIADVLGVSTSTVTTRIARAREALRTAVLELRGPPRVREVLSTDLETWTRSLAPMLAGDPATD